MIIQFTKHNNHSNLVCPNHMPKIINCLLKWTLSSNVFLFNIIYTSNIICINVKFLLYIWFYHCVYTFSISLWFTWQYIYISIQMMNLFIPKELFFMFLCLCNLTQIIEFFFQFSLGKRFYKLLDIYCHFIFHKRAIITFIW